MSKKIKEKDLYKSSDIALISAICYGGYQIESIDRQNPSKLVFSIKRDANLDNLIKDYFAHQLKVDALSYFNCLKEIKVQIYNTPN